MHTFGVISVGANVCNLYIFQLHVTHVAFCEGILYLWTFLTQINLSSFTWTKQKKRIDNINKSQIQYNTYYYKMWTFPGTICSQGILQMATKYSKPDMLFKLTLKWHLKIRENCIHSKNSCVKTTQYCPAIWPHLLSGTGIVCLYSVPWVSTKQPFNSLNMKLVNEYKTAIFKNLSLLLTV